MEAYHDHRVNMLADNVMCNAGFVQPRVCPRLCVPYMPYECGWAAQLHNPRHQRAFVADLGHHLCTMAASTHLRSCSWSNTLGDTRYPFPLFFTLGTQDALCILVVQLSLTDCDHNTCSAQLHPYLRLTHLLTETAVLVQSSQTQSSQLFVYTTFGPLVNNCL